jgi:DNA-binding HxlR family transcriptional regulator
MQAESARIVMTEKPRSLCPISLSLEVFGDRWTLLIVRDMMFAGKRHFREFFQSDEQISSNILADRLKMLVDNAIVTKADNPRHKQKAIYSLTEKGIALLPVFVQIGAWGRRYAPASGEGSIRSRALERGGPRMWEQLMAELRETHVAVQGGRQQGRVSSTRLTASRRAGRSSAREERAPSTDVSATSRRHR